jgi:hypothetical protein
MALRVLFPAKMNEMPDGQAAKPLSESRQNSEGSGLTQG